MLFASWITTQGNYCDAQKNGCYCKDMGCDSYLPSPGLAGEHGKGTYRQEDPTEPFSNCGSAVAGLHKSRQELYAGVQQSRQKKGDSFLFVIDLSSSYAIMEPEE
jgi:hypothetical protein